MGQRAGQRPLPMPLGRMHDHAGRLVDDNDRIILVQNRKRNRLRRRPVARHRHLVNDDLAALPEPQRRLADGAIDLNMTGFDRAADGRATQRRKLLGEKHIEPLPDVLERDSECLRPGWMFGRQRIVRKGEAAAEPRATRRLSKNLALLRRSYCCGDPLAGVSPVSVDVSAGSSAAGNSVAGGGTS